MTALTMQDVSRQSGLSGPTLRYYEKTGLLGPIDRDASSGHRRYRSEDLDTLQALACLRATGVSIEDMAPIRPTVAAGMRRRPRLSSRSPAPTAVWRQSDDPGPVTGAAQMLGLPERQG